MINGQTNIKRIFFWRSCRFL